MPCANTGALKTSFTGNWMLCSVKINIIRKETLRLLKQADMGKRVSLRRKMAKAAMNNDSMPAIFAQK